MPRAPRRCPGDNGNCTNLIRNTKYCEQHTVPWSGKRTTSSTLTSTAAWKQLRLRVLKRDHYQCQVREPGCTGRATQVDHIINTAADGAELDPDNCAAICPPCNARKAQRESIAARKMK
jgi:5-methylcytosine-specific restriction endonuclease McrA